MEKNKLEKGIALKDVLDSFIQAYAQRDTDKTFPDWLADRLRQELPEMEPEASTRLANEIIGAVAAYDQTLHDLNQAIEAGQSKEEWLAEQLAEAYKDMPLDAAGEALQSMESELAATNMQLRGEMDSAAVEDSSAVEAEPVEWNEYSVKAKAYGIGQQLNSMSLSTIADALDRELHEGETVVSDAVTTAFQKGQKAEVKAVVAGAVRVAAEKGLEKMLPFDIPIEVIGDMAGVAVEGAEALYDAVNGDISMTEAMDKAGRAGFVAGCRAGVRVLKRWIITNVPYGLLVVDLLGGLFDYVASSEFANDFLPVVRKAAVHAWEGIKKSKVVQGLKKLKRKVFG